MKETTGQQQVELLEIVEAKLTAFVRELEDANFRIDDIAFAIEDVLRTNWLDKAIALRQARADTPDDYVSDGNEG